MYLNVFYSQAHLSRIFPFHRKNQLQILCCTLSKLFSVRRSANYSDMFIFSAVTLSSSKSCTSIGYWGSCHDVCLLTLSPCMEFKTNMLYGLLLFSFSSSEQALAKLRHENHFTNFLEFHSNDIVIQFSHCMIVIMLLQEMLLYYNGLQLFIFS